MRSSSRITSRGTGRRPRTLPNQSLLHCCFSVRVTIRWKSQSPLAKRVQRRTTYARCGPRARAAVRARSCWWSAIPMVATPDSPRVDRPENTPHLSMLCQSPKLNGLRQLRSLNRIDIPQSASSLRCCPNRNPIFRVCGTLDCSRIKNCATACPRVATGERRRPPQDLFSVGWVAHWSKVWDSRSTTCRSRLRC